MFQILFLLLSTSAQASSLASLNWNQTFQTPYEQSEDGPSVRLRNVVSLSAKPSKTQKIALNVVSFHDYYGENRTPESVNAHQWGDLNVKYTDKNLSPFVMKHRLSAPTRLRSQERGLLTEYKGEFSYTWNLTPKFDLIVYGIPKLPFHQHPQYRNANGKLKANRAYEVSLISQLLYQVRDGYVLSWEQGFSQSRYHALNDKPAVSAENFLTTIAAAANVSDRISLAVGVGSETPAGQASFERPNLFQRDRALIYLETSISMF
ncbi:MAG: hypothetical protein KF789_12500 [Bdellovibrionaceae bacterium]|nr:hypothetical protein [Pseudobdellovibrionaceae bacterium]